MEPIENGPREVGVFAKIYDDGNDLMVWREDNETKDDFEARVLAMQSSEHETCFAICLDRHEPLDKSLWGRFWGLKFITTH